MAYSRRHKNARPAISALSTLLCDDTFPDSVAVYILFRYNENAQIEMASNLGKFEILQNVHFFGATFDT
jgi:hypothetical protein